MLRGSLCENMFDLESTIACHLSDEQRKHAILHVLGCSSRLQMPFAPKS